MAVRGSLRRRTPEAVAKARADLLETVTFLIDAGANLNIQTKVMKHLAALIFHHKVLRVYYVH